MSLIQVAITSNPTLRTHVFENASCNSIHGTVTLYGSSFQMITYRLQSRQYVDTLQLKSVLCRSDLQVGLFPVHSPLIRKSLLLSFPPLNNMLKFRGYSHSNWVHEYVKLPGGKWWCVFSGCHVYILYPSRYTILMSWGYLDIWIYVFDICFLNTNNMEY